MSKRKRKTDQRKKCSSNIIILRLTFQILSFTCHKFEIAERKQERYTMYNIIVPDIASNKPDSGGIKLHHYSNIIEEQWNAWPKRWTTVSTRVVQL